MDTRQKVKAKALPTPPAGGIAAEGHTQRPPISPEDQPLARRPRQTQAQFVRLRFRVCARSHRTPTSRGDLQSFTRYRTVEGLSRTAGGSSAEGPIPCGW
ncbi:hypothetical protein N658DRAFT_334640 [Parathielavia hyrcaniae]|uniref:Uncharacterized protein n=1 Tax=Parathielavia hyrcaniae TaxID=113614 RepID=A0AAN6SXR5_9PEZI|nr:hypothetical protein N658DRAFT_334640 [Parathielavia hyrcaniae]